MQKLTKGAATRQRAIEQAAPLLNARGYAGAAMSDLMAATGLQKGGLYRHFASKEALALESLRYTLAEADRVKFAHLDLEADGIDQLIAFVRDFLANPSPVAGGCPVLNTSVEHDDGIPAFRAEAANVAARWRDRLVAMVRAGQERQTLRASCDPETLAATLLAALEGAVALDRLQSSSSTRESVERFLCDLLETYRIRPDATD